MNFLAHAHLSFNEPQILAGNMISDFVKGKKQYDYTTAIQKGIKLHRAIDTFTDEHPSTQELKSFFRPQYRLYSGPFADIVYDHFLALDTNQFSTPEILKTFSAATYKKIEGQLNLLPERFQQVFAYMQAQDWLYNYQHTWLIERSFEGLVRRSAYLKESKIAFDIFLENYEAMKDCYTNFYPAIKTFAAHQLQHRGAIANRENICSWTASTFEDTSTGSGLFRLGSWVRAAA